MSFPIVFQSLWPLALLLAIPLLWWIASRTRTNLGHRHLLVVGTLRAAAIAFLALALMRPQWIADATEVSVVYALDVSRSVSSPFIESALDWIGEADRTGKPVQSGYIAFADRPRLFAQASDLRNLAVTEGEFQAGVIDQAATNLERALDEALLALDRDRIKRVVLLTDGNQTDGDVWRVLPRLKQAGVRVFPVPARVRDEGDTWLDGIEVPASVRADEPVTVNVRVFSPRPVRAQVRLNSGRTRLGSRSVSLVPGLNRVAFEIKLPQRGNATLSAELAVEGDRVAENNQVQQSVWVGVRPQVLYVEGQPASARYLRDALAGEGIEVKVAAVTDIPQSLAALTVYDALILSDVPARAIAAPAMQAIEAYVRDGGGLLFASGENVFGEQGYTGTTIENVLPVEFSAQEKRKDFALVIAMDRSYSMKGRKMELAKEAARASLDLLEEQHQFAVVAFDSQTHISVPMQSVRSKRKAEDQISRIQASGQTNIYPALGIVYRMLQKTEAKAKHVILLSDGDTHPADFEGLVKRMAAEKIVISTVAIGEAADRELMGNIAAWGNGRALSTVSAEALPQIFIEETQRAVRSNFLEESFKPTVRRPMGAFRGVDFAQVPELQGYVSTKPRDTAEVSLVSPNGAPILARWQYGLGKAVVFTSDVKNRWASKWMEWPGYGRLWAQLVREIMRRDSGEQLDFRVAREGSDAVVSLSSLTADGRFRGDLAPTVRVTLADGSSVSLPLRQTGAGSYGLRVPTRGTAAPVRFELEPSAGLPRQALARTGERRLDPGFTDEYRSLPPNLALLETLAAETGGKVASSVEEVFATQGDHSQVTRVLWPWFALLALLSFLADILVRRSPLAWRWLGS